MENNHDGLVNSYLLSQQEHKQHTFIRLDLHHNNAYLWADIRWPNLWNCQFKFYLKHKKIASHYGQLLLVDLSGWEIPKELKIRLEDESERYQIIWEYYLFPSQNIPTSCYPLENRPNLDGEFDEIELLLEMVPATLENYTFDLLLCLSNWHSILATAPDFEYRDFFERLSWLDKLKFRMMFKP